MKLLIFTLCILNLYINAQSVYDNVPKSKVVKCAACRAIISEIHDSFESIDPRKVVEIGGPRFGADGKQKPKKYAGSEAHITDLLDLVCKGDFKDYVQARDKETNQIELLKLVVNGKMNPHFSDYELIQDPDLNKGVTFHCESIVEDFEDDIYAYFAENSELPIKESKDLFCNKITNICPTVKDEL